MDYIYSISLFLLLLLLIAIDYICRLRKERRELRNYYDVLLTNILKGKHREKGLSNEKTKVIFGYSDTKQLEEAIKKDKEKLELVKQEKSEIAKEGFITIYCVSSFVVILFQLFPNNKIIQLVSVIVLSILNLYYAWKIKII